MGLHSAGPRSLQLESKTPLEPRASTSVVKGSQEAPDRRVSGILADIDAELLSFQELIEDSKRRIQALRKARELIVQSMGTPSVVGSPDVARAETTEQEPRRPRPGSQVDMVVRTAREVLLRKGRPMTRAELLDEIQGEGFEVKAAHPAKRIGKILWASDDFEHVGTGYWLKGVPLPPT